MANPERKIFIPDGDTALPHPPGVCSKALKLRDEILRDEDLNYRRKPHGRCSRREGGIPGCLVEIIPQQSKRTYHKEER